MRSAAESSMKAAPKRNKACAANAAENVDDTTVLATVTGTDPDLGGGNDATNDFENLTYSITGGNEGGLFEINATTGAISLVAGESLDFEADQQHVLTVHVQDGPGLGDDVDVTINVTDVDEGGGGTAPAGLVFIPTGSGDGLGPTTLGKFHADDDGTLTYAITVPGSDSPTDPGVTIFGLGVVLNMPFETNGNTYEKLFYGLKH